jgi:hypothetical protein
MKQQQQQQTLVQLCGEQALQRLAYWAVATAGMTVRTGQTPKQPLLLVGTAAALPGCQLQALQEARPSQQQQVGPVPQGRQATAAPLQRSCCGRGPPPHSAS